VFLNTNQAGNPANSTFSKDSLSGKVTMHTDSLQSKPKPVLDSTIIKHKPIYAYPDSNVFGKLVYPQSLYHFPFNKKEKIYISNTQTEANLLCTSTYNQYKALEINDKKELPYNSSLWFLSTIIICLLVLTWIKFFFNKYITQVFTAFFSSNQLSRMFQDKNLLTDRLYTFMNLFFFFTGGLYLFQSIHLSYPELVIKNDIVLYMICILLLVSIFVIRYLLNYLLGFFINRKQVMKEYLHIEFMLYKLYGIVLFPFVILMAFVQHNIQKELMFFSLIIIIVFYIIKLFRGLMLLHKKGFLIFYTFLYLCTIEILPMLLIYKIIMIGVSNDWLSV
jgi:hypothetical protein